jgi:hypothetical protein
MPLGGVLVGHDDFYNRLAQVWWEALDSLRQIERFIVHAGAAVDLSQDVLKDGAGELSPIFIRATTKRGNENAFEWNAQEPSHIFQDPRLCVKAAHEVANGFGLNLGTFDEVRLAELPLI